VRGAAVQILDGHGHICLIAPDLDLAEILRNWRPHLTAVDAPPRDLAPQPNLA
jgi:hypothetical protein